MDRTGKVNKRSFNIKYKLIFIGALFLGSVLAMELISTYNETIVHRTISESQLRQHQLQTLEEINVSLVTLTLAAMDIIIEKDSGVISSENKAETAAVDADLSKNMQKLETIADTGEERRLAEEILTVYPEYKEAIMNDLPGLVYRRADQAEFSRMDELIDSLNSRLTTALEKIIKSVEQENVEASETMLTQIGNSSIWRRLFAAVIIVVQGVLLLLLGRAILIPILSTMNMVRDIAEGEGDLTRRLATSGDEIGELSSWFNIFVSRLHGIISKIQADLSLLNEAADGLTTLSQSLAEGSEDADARSNSVASAAEEMSANMNTVAAASEQASGNVHMVASAVEEMNATVSEIAVNTGKARQIVETAVKKTDQASKRVNQLGTAADEINKVNEVITEISEQTNLLALNATIEAARAGEAGKGFAVVANEIKELAKQTAEATLEIRQKVEAIQGSSQLTVTEMSEIDVIINDVSEIVATIATAVEEQSASTGEIASSIGQASQGIAEVSDNVSQSSTVSGGISEEISGVSRVASELKSSSGDVSRQAGELKTLAGRLAEIINQFKL